MTPETSSTPEQLGSEMNEAQQTHAQQQPPTPSKDVNRIVIHHLSDLRYQDGKDQHRTLIRYRRYLDTIKGHGPDIVVVTGDITESGKQHDLRAVANFLATCFPQWQNELHKHIFVVPGVRDVNWESIEGLGWKTFLDSFKEFALPAYGEPDPDKQPPGVVEDLYVGYPICTCYQPSELSAVLKSEIETYQANYTQFTELRDHLTPPTPAGCRPFSRKRTSNGATSEQDSTKAHKELDNARTVFLQITEDYQPLALASGRVLRQDFEQFKTWSATLTSGTTKDPLKILITHHPLAIDMDQPHERSKTRPEEQSFKDLAQNASQAGFHIALHGHAHKHEHKPKALSGFSILGDAAEGHRLRQIGAASLSDTGTFNEIIAERRSKPADAKTKPQAEQQSQTGQTVNGLSRNGQSLNGHAQNGQPQNGQQAAQTEAEQVTQVAQGDWRFELRLINVNTADESSRTKPPFLLLNPEESAERLREGLESAAERRQTFDMRMRIAMGQFSERVHLSSQDRQQDRPNAAYLPQSAMQVIEAIIRDIIFNGYGVRVRILLKDVTEHRLFPKLTAAYLTPPIFDGPDTLVYPASVAAWSLVLGRSLIYPDIEQATTGPEDHEWLRATNKLAPLRQALEALNQELFARSMPNEQMRKQYESLIGAIKQLESNSDNAAIAGADMYQNSSDSGREHSYSCFICVPYPMRPRGGALPSLPETMVLDIGVRSNEKANADKINTAEIFTDERKAMLESIAELIGMMLTTANALGKPRGLWDARVRG